MDRLLRGNYVIGHFGLWTGRQTYRTIISNGSAYNAFHWLKEATPSIVAKQNSYFSYCAMDQSRDPLPRRFFSGTSVLNQFDRSVPLSDSGPHWSTALNELGQGRLDRSWIGAPTELAPRIQLVLQVFFKQNLGRAHFCKRGDS